MNAASFLDALLTATLWASVLVVLVLLLRVPVARRLGSMAAYGLWLSIPVQLLAFLLPGSNSTTAVSLPSVQAVTSATGESAALGALGNVLFAGWLIGLAVLAVGLLLQLVRAHRLVRSAQRLPDDPPRGLPLFCTDGVRSPAVAGLFRPVLLVPVDFGRGQDAACLDRIIRHEQCHARRRDNLANLLAYAIRAVFWFNPLIWIALRAFRADQELSCDEYALADADMKERLGYGRELLRASVDSTLPGGTVSSWTSKPTTRRRIEMLALHRSSRTHRAGGIALACFIAALSGATAADISRDSGEPLASVEPRAVELVNPRYPVSAFNERIEGEVQLEFRVRTDGSVDQIQILNSAPDGVFDDAAVRALAQWKFEPAMLDGQPIARRATQVMEFRLD
ncbi:M56 family metallopeptidase [Wenzhouxiangella marina]|uniref:Protein TonB n=1 Tax=Wenzhouxiangella marina TaxID=1579979 RepID=A0A0K0XUX8_9GAMM|nr:M56 family metallopeptidase [Wenzhouxiangella marina]AKS41514.1 hypothetical protein WM2015_1140 [Wenzhouxiangella marina]MBB6086727.1 TonB family protein [Wenzhouxiangella marina]